LNYGRERTVIDVIEQGMFASEGVKVLKNLLLIPHSLLNELA